MSLLRFFDRQRALALDRTLWRRVARCLLEELLVRPDYELGVHFIDAAEMTGLNENFLRHEGSTDVITFNHQENAGSEKLCGEVMRQSWVVGTPRCGVRSAQRADPTALAHPKTDALRGEIFISTDDALVHARRFRVRWPWEVTRYLVHGVLHLEGFDDTDPGLRRVMKRRENKLLKELSARFNLGKLGRQCH